MTGDELVLLAPMEGWVAPISETPDPVFAEKMLGDGVAIDPIVGEVRAPCVGEVIGFPSSAHAVTLRARNGAEILIHVGLETVALAGEGFQPRVRLGARVAAGELLLTFDLDHLARRAKSLMSPVVIVNGADFALASASTGRVTRFGEPLMSVRAVGSASEAAPAEGEVRRRGVRVGLAHGLHARPAALLAREAGRFGSEIAVTLRGRRANARSAVSVMALGVRLGDEIEIEARGDDAADAVEGLAALLAKTEASGEPPPPAPATEAMSASSAAPASPLSTLGGVPAAPGLAIGAAVRLVEPDVIVRESAGALAEEEAELSGALRATAAALEQRRAAERGQGREILEAHMTFLEDPDLIAAARAELAGGASAGVAWRRAIGGYVAQLRGIADPRMMERAADLADLERQVLLRLSGETASSVNLPDNAIVIADDLLPSQLMDLDPTRVAGLAISRGGPTSHVAILAAAMGVPAVVALGPRVLSIEDGALLVLDGDEGRLQVAPNQTEIAAAQTRLAQRRARLADAKASAREPCRTADGQRIEVFANLASVPEAAAAMENGAEGCGLLRTEFLFMDRDIAPGEAEQLAAYQAIADALDGHPLVIRTLDAGADKPVGYLPLGTEANPALGVRGIRVSLAWPELLRTQVRAILRVGPAGQARVLLPMIASLAEIRAARAIIAEVAADLGAAAPQLGAMIETPAAAVTADLLAAEVDFFSIGTNDLSQYALAMDRTEPQLAAQVDGLHPAVLRLIAETVRGASQLGRPVAACGALASDLAAAPILIGLGVTELSGAPGAVPELKQLIRGLSRAQCREIADRALAQTSAAEVRGLKLGGAGARARAGALS
ncbi:MAG TPA: phosphoenolpyruvate--protein phosphotransferase [Caulobacteraceae bacterium]|nr:phosphoenolpyruvate--protein phosphotransferase [Caulobacteraceae bacterium]